jgi:hypothetical protein
VIDAKSSESSVTPIATPKKIGSTPQRSRICPASRNPSGEASVFSVITAVITFARRPSGVRAVSTPITGPLTSGVKNVATKSAATTIQAGGIIGSSQSGTANARIPNVAIFSGATFRTIATAAIVPARAPAPRAV